MNTKQIPENVAGLIARKELQIKNELQAKELQDQTKRDTHIEKGRKILRERIDKALLTSPEWIREYEETERWFDDNELEDIGRGWNQLNNLMLHFSIPGLPPILHNAVAWMVAGARGGGEEDGRSVSGF